MAKQAELTISSREVTGKATKRLRSAGIIPANISGRGEASQAVQVEGRAFEELRRTHSTTGIISLRTSGARRGQTTLIRHVQRDPITTRILHIDFFRVSLRDRITVKVPLRFTGVAPGVKIEGGVLLHLLEALEVECAAGDLVEALEIDVSGLEHIDDTIHAKDIILPENYTLTTDPEEAVVKVIPPRVEKAEEALAEAPAEAPAEEAAPGIAEG